MRTNFQMTDQNITMVSGDTLSFNVIVRDNDGNPVTVDEASFKAKTSRNASTVAISKTLEDGISQEDGVLTVRVAPADTSSLVGFFYYDMDITVGDDRFTLMRGMLQIEFDVKGNLT